MLKFKIDTDRLTFGDLLSLESAKTQAMADLMARCLTDEAGEYYPVEKAESIIRAIPLKDLSGVVEAFGKEMEALKNSAVPPVGGGK
jgi:hypothetical protein